MQKIVSNWMLGLKPNHAIYPIAACSFFVANNVPSVSNGQRIVEIEAI